MLPFLAVVARKRRRHRALIREAVAVIEPTKPFVDCRSTYPKAPSNDGHGLPGLDEIDVLSAHERRRTGQRVLTHGADLGEAGVRHQLLRTSAPGNNARGPLQLVEGRGEEVASGDRSAVPDPRGEATRSRGALSRGIERRISRTPGDRRRHDRAGC